MLKPEARNPNDERNPKHEVHQVVGLPSDFELSASFVIRAWCLGFLFSHAMRRWESKSLSPPCPSAG